MAKIYNANNGKEVGEIFYREATSFFVNASLT